MPAHQWLSPLIKASTFIMWAALWSRLAANIRTQVLRLHGPLFIDSLPYVDNEWSSSERDLLSQCTELANALATSTARRSVMKWMVSFTQCYC